METPKQTQKTQQTIKSLRPNLALWFFPIIALVLSGWLFYSYYKKRGPTISLYLDDASGVNAGKTKVRFRGVAIGSVENVTISEDTKNVIATIKLEREAELFAVEGTKFWVVSPKVTFQGITGLETLIEGSYIAATPGNPDGEPKEDFKTSVNTESNESLENTTAYYLETPNVESVSTGDSVTFRGINVGNVSKVTLSKTAQMGNVQINIQNRYVKLIRSNTVFWRKVGVQANLGLFNSEVKINSLDSIMRGGVDFFTPDQAGPRAKPGSRFALSAAPPKGYEKWNPVLE